MLGAIGRPRECRVEPGRRHGQPMRGIRFAQGTTGGHARCEVSGGRGRLKVVRVTSTLRSGVRFLEQLIGWKNRSRRWVGDP